jgi:hypothetical protein
MPDLCNRRYRFSYTTALNVLAKQGIPLSQIEILAVGEHENYKGEILAQHPPPGTPLKKDTPITLKVGRRSAVDSMPYQFFYGLHGITSSTGEWEDRARALMAPFDAAVVRYEAVAEYEDLKNSFGLIEYRHLARFLSLFDFVLEDSADIDYAVAWASLYPSFHHWAGNPQLVAKALELLFGYRFEIVENIRMEHHIPVSCRYQLGSEKDRLGEGMILGRKFTDYDSAYEVVVLDVAPEETAAFLPGGSKRKKLEKALAICMPSHLEYRIRVRTKHRRVPVGKQRKICYLGYSTRL